MNIHVIQEVGFQVLMGLTLAMPLLEFLVSKTTTPIDDELLGFVKLALSYVPRVRMGK